MWSPCDSAYHCEFEGDFDAVNQLVERMWESTDGDSDEECDRTCELIHQTCMTVILTIGRSDIFSDKVVYNLLMGDQSDEERLVNAEILNTRHVFETFRSDLASG